MKKSKFSLAFLLLILTLTNLSSAQIITIPQNEVEYGNSLIRIFSENKVGFIDTSGKVVIPAKFANVYEFSEGLAAARVDGTFGFINTKGDFVIKPKYDFVQKFKNGAAVVYLNGKTGLLYNNGKEILYNSYSLIKFVSGTKAFVKTHSKKMGMINIDGSLVIDTLYDYVAGIYSGLIVGDIETRSASGREWIKSDVTVLDTAGNIIYPSGMFSGFSEVKNGLLPLTRKDSTGNYNIYTYIDYTGKVKFERTKYINFISGYDSTVSYMLNDSLFIIEYVDLDLYGNGKSYKGLYNINSQTLIKDTNWNNITSISNKSFYVTGDSTNKIINDRGEVLFDLRASGSQLKFSTNYKYIIISKDNNFAIYDAGGNSVIPFQARFISGITEFEGSDYIFYIDFTPDGITKLTEVKGLNTDFNWVIPKEHISFDIDKKGFVSASDSNHFYCYNPHGRLIYKSDLYGDNANYNIDFMDQINLSSGRFFNNSFNPNYSRYNINDNGVSVFIDERKDTVFRNKYKGLDLIIVNKGEKVVTVGTNYLMKLKLQAKDKDGKWKDIENEFSGGICGTGLEEEKLGQYDYLLSTIPLFEGEIKTVMRAELTYPHPKFKGAKIKIYSNEIECGINPAQFWRKPADFDFDAKDFRRITVY